jgi:hypothetical protein
LIHNCIALQFKINYICYQNLLISITDHKRLKMNMLMEYNTLGVMDGCGYSVDNINELMLSTCYGQAMKTPA